MTESEWWACREPQMMLAFLRDSGKLSQRKARLFAVAVCHLIWPLLTDERSRRAVEVAERHVDGLADDDELAEAGQAATVTCGRQAKEAHAAPGACFPKTVFAAMAAAEAAITEREVLKKLAGARVSVEEVLHGYAAGYAANAVSQWAPRAMAGQEETGPATLLRDIFGPLPFRVPPAIAEGILVWNDGVIVKLATSMYEEKDFSQERMNILADAMEEAGVTDQEVLGHCRQEGAVHVRGCWLVDLVLGKE